MTLRWRLTLAFATVVLVPLLVGGVLLSRAVPTAVQDRQQDAVAASARLTSAALRAGCERVKLAAEAAGRAVGAAGGPATSSLVDRGLVDGVRVTDASGRVLAQAGQVPADPADCGAGPATTGPAVLSAVVVLRTPTGAAAGTAVASAALDRRLLLSLADAAGTDLVLLRADGSEAARTAPPHGDRRVLSARAAAVPGAPYAVVALQAAERGPGLLLALVVVVVVALLLSGAIALLLARVTTRPLQELVEAAGRVAAGDLSTVIAVRSHDEVGRLSVAFNAMTDELRSSLGQLQAGRDELQAGLARLGDTLSSTHDLDRILAVVLESAMAATRARSGMVLLLDPARAHLVLAASRGLDVPLDLRLPVDAGVSGRVAQSAAAVRGWLGAGPDELAPAPGEPGTGSVVAVPLGSSGSVLGVLDLYGSSSPKGFGEEDEATIQTFAVQATVALDNVLLHEEAQRLATTDGLTGLHNYRHFTATLHQEVERAMRFGRPLALLMVDLDRFKQVNDTFGHPRGDAVLVELAARVRGQVRDVDTVARYGGEEVVVVLPETDEQGARLAAERLCDVVRRLPFGLSGERPVHLTVSVGVAVLPAHGHTAATLLGRADEALYDAKRAGRDQWRLPADAGAPLVSSSTDDEHER